MKFVLLLLILVLPLGMFGQNLKCCTSTEDIDSVINGKWKLKKSELNSRFNYTFKDTMRVCAITHATKVNEAYMTTKDFPKIEILQSIDGFEITFNYPQFYWTAKIEELSSKKMILGVNGTQLVFSKMN